MQNGLAERFVGAAPPRVDAEGRGAHRAAVGSWQTYQRASVEVPTEVDDVELRCAEGAVPRAIHGVLYRNGPGTSSSLGVPYQHPFDGDGHVVRFAFEDGRVRYRNRFVRTRERTRELAAGRPLYRSFGTNLPGGFAKNALRLRFKNAANTNVVHHAGRLYALWEGGLPHRLDPRTLETLSREDFEGKLQNRSSSLDHLLAPELPFSAHPKLDPESGELFNFGTVLGRTPRLVLYRLDRDGRLDDPESITLERLVFLHDFALTAKYRIFFLVPVAFRVGLALSGLAPPAEALASVPDRPTEILLVPRDGGPHVRLETRACFLFHFAYAVDEEDGRITVVGMRMPELPSARVTRDVLRGRASGGSFSSALPTRFVLDPARGKVVEERLSDRPSELPTVARQSLRVEPDHFFSIAGEPGGSDPFQHNVQRFDLRAGAQTIRAFAPDLPSEPIFAPPGFLLTLVYRAEEHRSDLYVLDADSLATVARLELPHHVPPGFHGTWLPG